MIGRVRGLLLVIVAGCGFKGPSAIGGDAPSGGDDGPSPEAGMSDAHSDAHTDGPGLDAAPSGLVAWYQAESVPPAMDSTGHGHVGTCLASCPTVMTAQVGSGFQFTGQRIDVADAPDLRLATFTLAFWAKWSAFPNNNAFSCPVGKYYGASFANSWQVCLNGTNGNGGVQWSYGTQHNSFDQMMVQTNLVTGVWHHVAGTWDGTTKRLYIDGTATPTTAQPGSAVKYDGGALTLGADIVNTNTIDSQFTGILDEVRIYDHALSATEIAALATP